MVYFVLTHIGISDQYFDSRLTKFGGSKTASDAINAGVALVTYPQQYLRGRMASVFFKAMALGEVDPDTSSCCIANSVSDYVTKALRLASDQDYRSRVVHAIREQSDRSSIPLQLGDGCDILRNCYSIYLSLGWRDGHFVIYRNGKKRYEIVCSANALGEE